MNRQPTKTNPVATLKAFRAFVAGLVLIAGVAVAFPKADAPIGLIFSRSLRMRWPMRRTP